jgi:hypothetical protein
MREERKILMEKINIVKKEKYIAQMTTIIQGS